MDVFYAYTYGTAGWLAIQAVPLIVMPKLIISLLSEDGHFSTALEVYFGRSLGFSLVILALISLFFTGSVPLSSSISAPVSLDANDLKAPYAVPLLRIMTAYHAIGLVYAYVRWTKLGSTGFLFGAMGYGFLAAVGLWCVVFGSQGGHISKRTGADKRTAGFPFKNASAYDKRKDRKMG